MRARKQSRCLSFSNAYLPFMHMSVTARTTSQTLAEGTLGWAGHIGSAQNDNVVLSARNIPASKKKVSTRNTKIKAPEYLTWEGWMSGHRDLPCNKGTASVRIRQSGAPPAPWARGSNSLKARIVAKPWPLRGLLSRWIRINCINFHSNAYFHLR